MNSLARRIIQTIGILVFWAAGSAEELRFETFPKIDIHVHIYEDLPIITN